MLINLNAIAADTFIMKLKSRYTFGTLFIILSHLAAIPILAIYGVHACPILQDEGFWYGCKYNAQFLLTALTGNIVVSIGLWLFIRFRLRSNFGKNLFLVRFYPYLSMTSHFVSFLISIHFLKNFLVTLDVPPTTLSRMSIAFLICAIMLSTLQMIVLDWMCHGWLRDQQIISNDNKSSKKIFMATKWLLEKISNEIPVVSSAAILSFYMFSKVYEVHELFEVPTEYVNDQILEGIKISGLIFMWYFFIRSFQLMKETRLVKSAQKHINELAKLNSQHYTSAYAAGSWTDIFKALNHTSEIIAQRSRLEKGLASYAVNKVVERVINSDSLQTHGELKTVTILMSDLRDFTQIANEIPPEKVVEVLNIYFNDMIEILTEHGFTIDKFIGDGILAYIEPEHKHVTNDSANTLATKAAFKMHEQIKLINEKLLAKNLPQLKLGIALHTGSVIVGSIGSKDRLQYTIIGDAVNTTSRMEGLCKQFGYGLIVSNTIYQNIETILQAKFDTLGATQMRGIANDIEAYGAVKEPSLKAVA